MKSADGGLAAIAYAPCVIDTSIGGTSLHVEVTPDSTYPFGVAQQSRIIIKVRPAAKSRFPIHLRIPSWADAVSCSIAGSATALEHVNDVKPGSFLKLDREWEANFTTEVNLIVELPVRLREGFNSAVSIQRGPIIYALPISPEWKLFKDRAGLPFDDWEVFPKSSWNYALDIDREHPAKTIAFEPRKPNGPLFTAFGAPLVAKVKGRRLRDWKLEKGAAAAPPRSPARSLEPLEELQLVPFGSTDLRMSEFPTLSSP